MIELGHKSIGRPVPKLKDRRDQSYPCHILVQAVFGEQIECCGMRRGRARVGLQALVVVEQANGDASAAQDAKRIVDPPVHRPRSALSDCHPT